MSRREPTFHGSMWWTYSEFAWLGLFTPLANGEQFLLRYEMSFHRQVPEIAALEIKAFCQERRIDLVDMLLQPDLFPKPRDVGEHVPETFNRCGIATRPGTKNRIASMSRIRSWLEPMPRGNGARTPTLLIHDSCQTLLSTLPAAEENTSDREDIQAANEDAYPVQALGFFVMSRPMPAIPGAPTIPRGAIGHDVEEIRAELRARRV